MYDNQEQQQVTLLCENGVMNDVIDKFSADITVKKAGKNHFSIKVSVCTSQTFYVWIFQWKSEIRIESPEKVVEEYKVMAKTMLEC